ncbi:SAMHD1, partial [Symbiodinium sp. CCMP2592]
LDPKRRRCLLEDPDVQETFYVNDPIHGLICLPGVVKPALPLSSGWNRLDCEQFGSTSTTSTRHSQSSTRSLLAPGQGYSMLPLRISEVDGLEWAFGDADEDDVSGVYCALPEKDRAYEYRQKVYLGETGLA